MIWLDKNLAYGCYHVISFKPKKCFANFRCTASNNVLHFHGISIQFIFIKSSNYSRGI